jgi:quinol monooxygenase YgiN
MKALYAEFTVLEGCEQPVAELVAQLAVDVRAEDGCVMFDPFTRTANPRAYVIFEIYRDEQAFVEHQQTPHSRRFNAALTDLIQGDGSTLEWLVRVA